MPSHHRRFLQPHEHLSRPFGQDRFGVLAEKFARSFGTPKFLVIQTLIVGVWILMNTFVVVFQWDPYPFILLNLMFSTQAAYAAPLILLAQTRQADRDKAHADAVSRHMQEESDLMKDLLRENTEMTRQIKEFVEGSHVDS